MGKKKNWFDRLKRFFSSDTKYKQEKKKEKKKWAFGKLKSKCLPALPAPSLSRAEHEQSKHAVAVAVATAIAAEAAVAAARAAAEVVRLTGTSYRRPEEIAAIKIQTAFRGYLARSALKALKGLVKLQALIRGQEVRRQTKNTFRGLRSLMKIQSQARASRLRTLADCQAHEWKGIEHGNTKNSEVSKAEVPRADVPKNGRKWNNSIQSQENMINLLNNRREAATKRERAMEYASSYQDRRRPTTPVSCKFDSDVEDGRWSWLDEWVGSQPLDKDIPEIFSTPCKGRTKDKADGPQLRYSARRSFNRRTSLKDDDSFSISPSCPSYMTPTVSAKSRSRSLSTPKQRVRTVDSCSEYCAPSADQLLSPVPSMTSDVGFRKTSEMRRSPRPKSRTGPTKCCPSPDYVNFDSERSLLNWDKKALR